MCSKVWDELLIHSPTSVAALLKIGNGWLILSHFLMMDVITYRCWDWSWCMLLTHWGRTTRICVSKLTIIASDNGLSPGRRQAIIWNNAEILSIGLLGTNFNEILIGIQTFSFKKMHLKVSSAKWRPFCLGLNVLKEAHGGVSLC